MRKEIREILVCPACKRPLDYLSARDILFCSGCVAEYEIISGVPVMLYPARKNELGQMLLKKESRFMVDEYCNTLGILDRLAKRTPWPRLMFYTKPWRRKMIYEKLYATPKENKFILSVGGGPTRNDPREINLNIALFTNVDVIGDGADIPFADESFDSIICTAVLEHVPNPQRITQEMYRVLKKDGYVYAETPLLFIYHSYPCDYFRYTKNGLEQLFSQFNKIDVGIAVGPTSSLLESLNAYLLLLFPTQQIKLLRKIISGIFRIIFWPFKYLDIYLNRKEASHAMAAGLYFFGQKKL